MAFQINGVSLVCSTVCPGADKTKHQSSASLAFVRGINRPPVNSPHEGSVTRKWLHLMTSSSCSIKSLRHGVIKLGWHWLREWLLPDGIKPLTDPIRLKATWYEFENYLSKIIVASSRAQWVTILRPKKNCRNFSDDIFKCISLNEIVWISLKFVPKA